MKVFVIGLNGTVLMPTKPQKARKLLKEGLAEVQSCGKEIVVLVGSMRKALSINKAALITTILPQKKERKHQAWEIKM